MACKVVSEIAPSIRVTEMKDGQIAVIDRWDFHPHLAGQAVQRYKDILILLGAPSGRSYSQVLLGSGSTCRVRILRPGAQIEVLETSDDLPL